MSTYFEAIRTFFVILLGLALTAAFLRRRSAAVRNLACRCLLVAAWVTPLVGTTVALLPGLPVATVSPATIRALPAWTPTSMMPKEAGQVRRAPDADLWASYRRESQALSAILAAQILGIVLLAMPGCLGWLRLQRFERGATVLERHAGLTILRANDPALRVPVTYGLPAKILLPADSAGWPEARIRAAVLHEAAHVRRRDWMWGRFMWVFTLMNWWNPAAHLLAHAMRTTSEAAADDEVLADGVRPSDYARELLAVVARASSFGGMAVAMVGRGGLRGRVRAILDRHQDRRRTTLALGAANALLVGAVTLALGTATTQFARLHVPIPAGAREGSLFEATDLPGGDTVQIAALQAFEGPRELRWRPEGYAAESPLPVEIDPDRFVHGRQGLFVHIRVGAAGSGDRSFKVLSPAGHAWGMAPIRVPAGEGENEAWDLRLWTSRPRGYLTADFAVGVASGARTVDRFPLDPTRTWAERASDRNGVTTQGTTLALPAAYESVDSLYTLIAADGRRFVAHCDRFGLRENRESQVQASLPTGTRLVSLEVASRPYVWTAFRGVRLQPDGDVTWRAPR